jgi:hypothetical protein
MFPTDDDDVKVEESKPVVGPESSEESQLDEKPEPDTTSEYDPVADPFPESTEESEVPPNRLYRFAKKLMDRRELAEDTKDLMVAFLSTSDRAKTEMIKMTAREVRNYLEELRLKDDLLNLVRSHSLEVSASFSLKPIEKVLAPEETTEDEG